MSTQFTNRQWRLPNNENKDKQSNYSMDFDGSSYVDAGNDSSLTPTNSISISLWVKTNDSGNYIGLIDKWSSSTGYMIHLGASGVNQGKPVFGIGASDISSSIAVNDGSWHHVAVTCDNTTGYIYVDGVQTGTGSLTMSGISNSDNLKIAGDNASTFYLDGQIDAVSIYNYALSSSQVTTLYGSSSTGIGNPMSLSPKPVAYYPLGDQDAFNGANYLVPNSSLKDYAFSFNNSQEINCGNDSSLQMDTVFTMSCWINTTSTSRGSIFGTYISNGYYIDLMASGTVQGGYHSTGSHFLRPSSSTVNDGSWHHVCYVISGTATDGSDLDVYVDGQLNNGSFTSSGTPSGAATTNPFKINLSGYAGRYTGKTSNVQIFNSALSSTDVETLYNNGSPLTSMSGFTSLQGWWKLDASATYDSTTTTWTIEDSSSNSNDGTSSGMTQANLVQSDLSFKTSISPFALDFDAASSQNINVGTVNLSSSWSISFWAAWTHSSNYKVAFNGSTGLLEYTPQTTSAGYIRLYDTTNGYFNVTPSINDGNWHNVIFTYNNSTSTITTYTDGYLSDSRVSTASATNLQSIGGGTPTGVWFWEGKLSNISIWNTALTSTQVSEIYSEGIPQNLLNHSAVSSLVSWWQLGSNSSFNTNWTVLDEVAASGNNGTSSNMGEDAIVDGVGSSANGLSSGMGGDEVVGDAPYSTANSLSVNMDVLDRVTDTPS